MATAPITDSVADYIISNWDNCVRKNVHRSNVVEIPLPHTVGSPAGNFNVLFYWDTYFANLGLIASGRIDLAKANCDALLWWIDQKGFVPNSAFVGDDNRSQPPFLSEMIADVYRVTGDTHWLSHAFSRLEREYNFWKANRTFSNGLSRFGHQANRDYLLTFYQTALVPRLKFDPNLPLESRLSIASELLAEAESGQDFTPIYGHQATHYADVELNTLLYLLERNLSWFAGELGLPSEVVQRWHDLSIKRADLIRSELWDDRDGLFRPKDQTKHRFSSVAHLGAYFPLWAGIATANQASRVAANLHRFEHEFGLAQTEPYGETKYQWAYPRGWPPSQLIVAEGLERYGYREDARRIARKYCELQQRFLEEDGHLWEKFDVLTGKPSHGEYPADPMLGWTAGAYLKLKQLLQNHPTPS